VKKIVTFLSILSVILIVSNCNNPEAQKESGREIETQEPARQAAIDFTLVDLDGVERTLSQQKGNVVLVDFWASWCRPCVVEIPHLKEFHDKYQDQGLILWGVSLDNKEEKMMEFIQKLNINYTILLGNQAVANKYNVQGIPTTFLYDKKNRIAYKHVGFAPGMEKQLEEEILELLNE
jgi:peroxiredoxin